MDSAPTAVLVPTEIPSPARPWLARYGVRLAVVALAAVLRLLWLDLRPPHFDEGVNGWFVDQMQKDGYYRYDPTNYHGPLHFYVLFLFKCLFGRNLYALRLPGALLGVLTVDWLFRFERFFGRRLCAWAALAMALSPGYIYYQRDAIHESELVFFMVLACWGVLGLWQTGERSCLWAAGLGLAGMILTKETYLIHVCCLLAAVPCMALMETWLPSAVPFIAPLPAIPEAARPASPWRAAADREVSEALRAIAAAAAPRRWTQRDFLAVCATGLGAILFFYSGNFFHLRGIEGLVTAFVHWTHKAHVGEGHIKTWHYWLKLIWRHEPWALAGLALSIRYALLPGVRDWRIRLLAFYGMGTLTAYSLIPYKTPWCIISFAWPFFFTAGAALDEAATRWPRSGTWAAALAGAALTGWSGFLALRLNFWRDTDEREDYVYVQTFDDVNDMVRPLLALAHEDARNYHISGAILCDSTYPLPWLLGDFNHVGYYADKARPADYNLDFLLVSKERAAEAEAHLKSAYFKRTYRLRPVLSPLVVYLRADRFAHLLPGRTPEFKPAPAAQAAPAPAATPPGDPEAGE